MRNVRMTLCLLVAISCIQLNAEDQALAETSPLTYEIIALEGTLPNFFVENTHHKFQLEASKVRKEAVLVNGKHEMVFFYGGGGAILACKTWNNSFILIDSIWEEDMYLEDFIIDDINDDGITDLISVWVEMDTYVLVVAHYSDEHQCLFTDPTYILGENDIWDHEERMFIKPKNHMVVIDGVCYFNYGFNTYDSRPYVLMYGFLDYTKDEAREIFFHPISEITPEEWQALVESGKSE